MSHSGRGYGNRGKLAPVAKLRQYRNMLRLPYDCHRCLREDVEQAYPEEACGVLLGRLEELDAVVVRLIACRNAAPEPCRRYAIAPAGLIAAQQQAQDEGLEILGFYHSHPDHPAAPSATDLREAHWTGYIYLICGVEKGRLADIAALRLMDSEKWVAERVHFEPPEN
jgi:proteasome lid subunit RPN8/RPN11